MVCVLVCLRVYLAALDLFDLMIVILITVSIFIYPFGQQKRRVLSYGTWNDDLFDAFDTF